MIRPSDFTATQIQRVTTATPVWTHETRSVLSWFEGANATPIVGMVNLNARNLTVEEHRVRVLTHLIGERELP